MWYNQDQQYTPLPKNKKWKTTPRLSSPLIYLDFYNWLCRLLWCLLQSKTVFLFWSDANEDENVKFMSVMNTAVILEKAIIFVCTQVMIQFKVKTFCAIERFSEYLLKSSACRFELSSEYMNEKFPEYSRGYWAHSPVYLWINNLLHCYFYSRLFWLHVFLQDSEGILSVSKSQQDRKEMS